MIKIEGSALVNAWRWRAVALRAKASTCKNKEIAHGLYLHAAFYDQKATAYLANLQRERLL